MANITIPHTFVSSTVAQSAQVNANFAAIATAFNTYAVQTDVSRTITASPTFAADILFTDALYDIGKSGATRPRDGFFSRNVAIGGTLGVTGISTLTGGAVAGGEVRLSYAVPRITIKNTSGAVDEKTWDFLASGTQLFFRSLNDIENTAAIAFTINRAGNVINLISFAQAVSVLAGGIAVTGNSTITGTLGGVTTLSCTTVTATNLGGTLSTAAQPNVTSVGTLSSLTVSGALTATLATAAQGSVTSLGTLTSLTVSGTSALAAVTVSSTVTLSTAASRIIPGATSLAFRNNANSADNLILADAGAATFRTSVLVTGAFGCNGATVQTAFASGGALSAYGAGGNGLAVAGDMAALHSLVVAMRAALVANGTMS